jgi:hypothetical protein
MGIIDLDKSGHGYQRVRTFLGPSLGWVEEFVQPATDITIGGTYVVQPGDSVLLVDVAAAVNIQLPDVVRWMAQTAYRPATAFGRTITIKDIGGNAANFNIVVTPFGQQAIDGLQQSLVIGAARANVTLTPLLDQTGWIMETNSGIAGGPGGGDVFKAGNNTFTGVNAFNGPITVPTVPPADNTQTAASTAYVQSQGFITGVSLAPYALLASPTFTGSPQAPTPAPSNNSTSIATTAFVQSALVAGYQPLDSDLTSIAAQTTNNAFYYRVGGGSWAPVVIGGGLNFSGGVLGSTAGGGNVSSVGTPTNGQLARWTSATQIEGVDGTTLFAPLASPTFTGDPKAPTPATADNDTSIATTAYVKSNLVGLQPLDGDLTALSALLGTNTIYYRSGTDTWSPVTFSGLTFSGGVLTATSGGGNVSNNGTPNPNEVAQWVTSTAIKGVPLTTWRTNADFFGTETIRSAVGGDGLNLTGAAGQALISAQGNTADIGLLLSAKGNAAVSIYGANFSRATAQFQAAAGSNTFLTIVANAGFSSLTNNPAANPIYISSPTNLTGVTDGSNAPAGYVGEFLSVSFSAFAITSGTTVNMTSLSLTAGDWDVWLSIDAIVNATATQAYAIMSMSTTSGTHDFTAGRSARQVVMANSFPASVCPMARFNLTATTTVFAVGQAVAANLSPVNGTLMARRRR